MSKNPALLDTLLTIDLAAGASDLQSVFSELACLLISARDFEDEMDIVRRFKNEKQFQIGVQLIRHQVTAREAGQRLSDIAEAAVLALLHRVEIEFARKHEGYIPGGLAIIALGRLGVRELTFSSDIDLVLVYDAPDSSLAQHHDIYNKLSQRFINALTVLTREGRLYDVDTRLRPSGANGALAVSIDAYDKYFAESAWTFEFMALTRARVISDNPKMKKQLNSIITHHLGQPRDPAKLMLDISGLRDKITKEFGSNDPWNIKYAHGGLIDLDFLAQYFVLLHPHYFAQVMAHSTDEIISVLVAHKLMDKGTGSELIKACRFFNSLFMLLRLCSRGRFNEITAPQGLKQLIADNLELPQFEDVKITLLAHLANVTRHFRHIIHS